MEVLTTPSAIMPMKPRPAHSTIDKYIKKC